MRVIVAAMLLCLALLPGAVQAQPEFDDPVALIQYTYAPYGNGDFPDEMTELFSPTLTQLWNDMVERSAELPLIDFDPFINAQDYDITGLVIDDPVIGADQAVVAVSFLNFGEPQDMRFTLVRRVDGWKIDDIETVGGEFPWRLSELLAADPLLN